MRLLRSAVVAATFAAVMTVSTALPALAANPGKGDVLTTKQVIAASNLPANVTGLSGTVRNHPYLKATGWEWTRDSGSVAGIPPASAEPTEVGFFWFASPAAAKAYLKFMSPSGGSAGTSTTLPDKSVLVIHDDFSGSGTNYRQDGNAIVYATCYVPAPNTAQPGTKKKITTCAQGLTAAQAKKIK